MAKCRDCENTGINPCDSVDIECFQLGLTNDDCAGIPTGFSRLSVTLTGELQVCSNVGGNCTCESITTGCPPNGGNFATNPTATDDEDGTAGNGEFCPGAFWQNTLTGQQWILQNADQGAAVWVELGCGSPGIDFAGDPTVNDDACNNSGRGSFCPGALWQNTLTGTQFILQNGACGAAVWVEIGCGANGLDAATDPTVGDDDCNTSGNGSFCPGALWQNTLTGAQYILQDSSCGAAVWVEIQGCGLGGGNDFNGIPTTDDDACDTSGRGPFCPGAIWTDLDTGFKYVLQDSTCGAAVWVPFDRCGANGIDAAANPTVNDDECDNSGNGHFCPGALWQNTTTGQQFILQDATCTAAVWVELPRCSDAGVNSGAFPTANDDACDTSGNGHFCPGTLWRHINGPIIREFILQDATCGAAVWVELTCDENGGNFGFAPTANDDACGTGGNGQFCPGALWVETDANGCETHYVLQVGTCGAAVWSEVPIVTAGDGITSTIVGGQNIPSTVITGVQWGTLVTADVDNNITSAGGTDFTLVCDGCYAVTGLIMFPFQAYNHITNQHIELVTYGFVNGGYIGRFGQVNFASSGANLVFPSVEFSGTFCGVAGDTFSLSVYQTSDAAIALPFFSAQDTYIKIKRTGG